MAPVILLKLDAIVCYYNFIVECQLFVKFPFFFQKFCPPIDPYFRIRTEYSPVEVNDVHWNFDKFMVGRDGRIISRYHPRFQPSELRDDIITALSNHRQTHGAPHRTDTFG